MSDSYAIKGTSDECYLLGARNFYYCRASGVRDTGSMRPICTTCSLEYGDRRHLWQSSSRQGIIDQDTCARYGGALFCGVRYRCSECSLSYNSSQRFIPSRNLRFGWDQKTCMAFSNTDPPVEEKGGSLFCNRVVREVERNGQRTVIMLFPGKSTMIVFNEKEGRPFPLTVLI